MTELPRVLELRRELADLGDPEPGTADLAAATRASILAELADLGALATPAAAAPRPLHLPVRVQAHHPAPRALPASSHPLPAAPAAPEPPMPKPTPSPAPQDPQARLAQLLERLAHNEETKNSGAAYATRGDIRRHCGAHGLPVPAVARKRTTPKPTAAQRPRLPKVKAAEPPAPAPATAPHGSASPAAPAAHGAEPPRALRAAHRPAPGADPADAPNLSAPAARIRALRSQALELLPQLEDLTQDAAREAHDEMDLLAKVLVLGGEFISRRTA